MTPPQHSLKIRRHRTFFRGSGCWKVQCPPCRWSLITKDDTAPEIDRVLQGFSAHIGSCQSQVS